jgi:YLATT-like protein/pYEATS domain-containing protein involved in immunity
MFTIMLFAGVCGGVINYYLPLNNPEPGKFLDKLHKCIILGVGATLLVPIFLELAQSKLMEKVHFGWGWQAAAAMPIDTTKKTPDTIVINSRFDTTSKKLIKDTVTSKKNAQANAAKVGNTSDETGTGKQYFLWAAYCLLAGAAGFRFINMLISNVVKSGEMNKVLAENKDLKKDKVFREMNSQQSQAEEIARTHQEIIKEKAEEIRTKGPAIVGPGQTIDEIIPVMPTLPPITHPEDPQKGRFGGRAEVNGRRLRAEVIESNITNFYSVKLIVESTDPIRNLNSEVIFYLHDTFTPSVFTYKPEKPMPQIIKDDILSYGAFTVGVVTDNGKTMLELDLSEDKRFPKEFRER